MVKRKRERPPLWFEETFDRIRRLEEEFHRMMSDFWRSPFDMHFTDQFFRTKPEISSISVDISETGSEVIIRADLPGFKKEEIKLRATEDEVIIEGEKKEEKVEEEENYFRKERRYGKVKRVIPLPVQVIPEKAKAKFRDGVLEIRIPKVEQEEEEEREIEIE